MDLLNNLCTLICPVAHAPALPLVAAPIFAAVAVLLSPLDVVQLPALEFINFALFDCLVVFVAELAVRHISKCLLFFTQRGTAPRSSSQTGPFRKQSTKLDLTKLEIGFWIS